MHKAKGLAAKSQQALFHKIFIDGAAKSSPKRMWG
jgi:hypothetical protein